MHARAEFRVDLGRHFLALLDLGFLDHLPVFSPEVFTADEVDLQKVFLRMDRYFWEHSVVNLEVHVLLLEVNTLPRELLDSSDIRFNGARHHV